MRAVFDLLKIVHGFRVPETVLFKFVCGAAALKGVSFRTPYIMKRFNQLGEPDECRWI
jgi:hypothetical protein